MGYPHIFLASCSHSFSAFPDSTSTIYHPVPKLKPHIIGFCYGLFTTYFSVAVSFLLFLVSLTSLKQASLNLFAWPCQGSKKEIFKFLITPLLSSSPLMSLWPKQVTGTSPDSSDPEITLTPLMREIAELQS